jgi:hypothetical protein
VPIDIAQTYSYRHAESILDAEFAQEKAEILNSIQQCSWAPKPQPKKTKRQKTLLTIDPRLTNLAIEQAFKGYGWEISPRIISAAKSNLASDFKKGKVQVEVQLGNMARWYTDVFKFLLSYSADDIEIGVLAVPVQHVAKMIDENVAYFERVTRELPYAKMGITLPIWVLGLG